MMQLIPDPATMPGLPYGAHFYDTVRDDEDDTRHYLLLTGDEGGALSVDLQHCPHEGCANAPAAAPDFREGTLLWSDPETWTASHGHVPKAGEDVVVPHGWDLVLDTDTARLGRLTVEGRLTFDGADRKLTARQVLVRFTGELHIGSEAEPYPGRAQIVLHGSREEIDSYAVTNDVVIGDKFLAATEGGTIKIYGRPTGVRWTRLRETVPANPESFMPATVKLAERVEGWEAGMEIVLTSSTFNGDQWERASVLSVAHTDEGTDLQVLGTGGIFQMGIKHEHAAARHTFGEHEVDMSAEVAILSGNSVTITSEDGGTQFPVASPRQVVGYGRYGAQVVVQGEGSVGELSGVTVSYCGQAGLGRPCVRFIDVRSDDPLAPTARLANSSVVYGMDSAVGVQDNADGVVLEDNVILGSFDASTVYVKDGARRAVVRRNLALGTQKVRAGKSGFDSALPATFEISAPGGHEVVGNVAAGSDRLGFLAAGAPCDAAEGEESFRDNVAHSSLAGLVLTRAGACTLVRGFQAYRNWDFGIITMRGIDSDVVLDGVVLADNMHAGLLPLVKGAMVTAHEVTVRNSLFVGHSSEAACGMCVASGDPSCHQSLSPQSYQKDLSSPEPRVGAVGAVFALAYSPGPDHKPWDSLKGYNIVHGRTTYVDTTFANFGGDADLPGVGACHVQAFALANHPKNPEAFHPTHFQGTRVVNVPSEALFKHYGPNPKWRHLSDCGEATWERDDGSVIELNCAGPNHVHWRDEDGGLTGVVGIVSGTFMALRQHAQEQTHLTPAIGVHPTPWGDALAPFEQGDAGAGGSGGPCYYVAAWRSYMCAPMVAPEPPARPLGLQGDAQLVVIESRDKDSEDRNVSPVLVRANGQTDVLISAMDHGWCFAYTCQKRLSTFWTYVPVGDTVKIDFTGTPPSMLRVWTPYMPEGSQIAFEINYFEPLRRFMWTPDLRRMVPADTPVGLETAAGVAPGRAYHWDQNATKFYARAVGPGHFEVRTERVVEVTMRLALSVDDFYDTELFVFNVSQLLGIEPDRLRVVDVVADGGRSRRLAQGSTGTVVTYQILDSDGPMPEPTFDTSQNLDPETVDALVSGEFTEDELEELIEMEQRAAKEQEEQESLVGVAPAAGPSSVSTAPTVVDALRTLKAAAGDARLTAAVGAEIVSASVAANDPAVIAEAELDDREAGSLTIVNVLPTPPPPADSSVAPSGSASGSAAGAPAAVPPSATPSTAGAAASGDDPTVPVAPSPTQGAEDGGDAGGDEKAGGAEDGARTAPGGVTAESGEAGSGIPWAKVVGPSAAGGAVVLAAAAFVAHRMRKRKSLFGRAQSVKKRAARTTSIKKGSRPGDSAAGAEHADVIFTAMEEGKAPDDASVAESEMHLVRSRRVSEQSVSSFTPGDAAGGWGPSQATAQAVPALPPPIFQRGEAMAAPVHLSLHAHSLSCHAVPTPPPPPLTLFRAVPCPLLHLPCSSHPLSLHQRTHPCPQSTTPPLPPPSPAALSHLSTPHPPHPSSPAFSRAPRHVPPA